MLKERAARQAETRSRIVESAIELHRTKGPANTTLSEVARLAGVQRHTLYRHFPDERSLSFACSGTYIERNPAPDPSPWRRIADPRTRLHRGLNELYAYFEANEAMFTCVLRDAEFHDLTREMFTLRSGERLGEIRSVLSEGLSGARALALLDLALDFRTWRRLRDSGLAREDAVETMVDAVATS